MKRGLIEWDRAELHPETLEARRSHCRALLAERGLDGLILYTDVWRSGQACYLINFIPYWNLGLLLVPREGELILVTGLSPGSFSWIRETAAISTVVTGNPVGVEAGIQVNKLGWKRVGMGEREHTPHGILSDLTASLPGCELVDATKLLDALRDGFDLARRGLYRRAREIAGAVLAEAAHALPGKSGWEAAGLLEGALRRRGATDVEILIAAGSNARWPTHPAAETLTGHALVMLSVEYKGHWVQVGRPLIREPAEAEIYLRTAYAHLVASLRPFTPFEAAREDAQRQFPLEDLSLLAWAGHRSFPFTAVASLAGLPGGTAVSLHLTGLDGSGTRWWWGDSFWYDGSALEPLIPEGRP
jgi:hypothetical protein